MSESKLKAKKKKNYKTEQWYLLSYKDQIMSYKNYNLIKPDVLYVNNKINNKKQLMVINETKKALNKNRRGAKRGRWIPFIYNNRIYFGKRSQKGTGVVSRVIAHL